MQCPSCQHPNRPTAKFCDECGHRFVIAVAKNPPKKKAAAIKQTGSGTIARGKRNATTTGPHSPAITARDIHGNVTINPPPATTADSTGSIAAAYLKAVIRDCAPLKLKGIDPQAVRPNAEPLSLSSIYVDLATTVMLPEKMSLAAFLKSPPKREEMAQQDKLRPAPALEAVACHRQIVLLGAPGSGKSTLVQYLALRLAEVRQGNQRALATLGKSWTGGPLLPVRVTLRQFAAWLPAAAKRGRASHLWDFIAVELKACGLDQGTAAWVQSEANGSGALFLLDGLDETQDPFARARMAEAVAEFAKSAGDKSRFLLTSRPYAWEEIQRSQQDGPATDPMRAEKAAFAELLAGFPAAYRLADFEPEQTVQFIGRWYQALVDIGWMSAADADKKRTELAAETARRDYLRYLSRNPLLLTLMATLHSNRTRLPDDRADLYNEVVELLLQRWNENIDADRGLLEKLEIPTLKLSDLRLRIEELAFDVHGGHIGKDGVADIAKGRLLEAFRHLLGGREDKAALVVEYVEKRAGLLLDQGHRDGQQWFTFPHRTFQEFLAGCHLAGHPDFAAKALRLAEDDPGHWREVLKFAARQATASRGVPAADLLVGHQEVTGQSPSEMDFRKAVLAAEQLLEIGLAAVSGDPNHDVIRRRVAGWLVALLEHGNLPAKERAQAGDLLAKLGDPRLALVPGQLEDLGAMEFCLVPVGPFIMGDGDERHRNEILNQDFWISRHPVTVAQFDLFVQAGGYGMAELWPEAQAAEVWKAGKIKGRNESEWRDRPNDYGDPFNLPNHPVVGLTWYEALAFTRWLSARWCKQLPVGSKLTLPSEAEWEKAARGGERLCQPRVIRPLGALGSMEAGRSETAPNPQAERTYPWGDSFDADLANCDETGIGTTSAAGCFGAAASPCGAEDLAGNVWEWTTGDGSDACVVRGGSFDGPSGVARCAGRSGGRPGGRVVGLGFRVVASPF